MLFDREERSEIDLESVEISTWSEALAKLIPSNFSIPVFIEKTANINPIFEATSLSIDCITDLLGKSGTEISISFTEENRFMMELPRSYRISTTPTERAPAQIERAANFSNQKKQTIQHHLNDAIGSIFCSGLIF